MREIKFRVLIDHKIYYQDKYNAYGDNLASIDICKKTITITSFYNYKNVYRFEDEEVKLMQYTGVKDKNGTEIYEGDIYHVGDKNIRYLVVWFDSGFEGKQLRSTSYAGLKSWAKDIEILGNIYENKNLLEENRWANTR